jgi:outer membrane protein TolC
MRPGWILFLLLAGVGISQGLPTYSVEEAVALAKKHNPEIAMAAKQVEAARGGVIEAKAGSLPSVVSTGFLRTIQRQEPSRLRSDDYSASVRLVQSLYTGGAVPSQKAIARLTEEKRTLEYQALVNRVAMDIRVAFYDVLLSRAKVRVREQSVGVLEEELKTQRERFSAGLVGSLNVSRADVALANERPELIDAQTRLDNSYLRLSQLIGLNLGPAATPQFEAGGELQYHSKQPDLNECLAHADLTRPEIRAAEIDVEIENQQLILDQSESRPKVEAFAGYEVYSEPDPFVGPEFNHGYIVGLNGTWRIFDGFATRGRLQATRARRDAALKALEAARRSAASDVRSAFLDLQQADRVLESETRNVQNADQSLEIAKGNLSAGLGTQLDVLQAASDVTRTRTTRLGAFYLHNVALARLARASAREVHELGFAAKSTNKHEQKLLEVAAPPSTLGGRK